MRPAISVNTQPEIPSGPIIRHCPKCGSLWVNLSKSPTGLAWRVLCRMCGYEGHPAMSQEKALDNWNEESRRVFLAKEDGQ